MTPDAPGPAVLVRGFMSAATAADSGCSHCARQVIEEAMRIFPDLPWRDVWRAGRDADPEGEFSDFEYFDELFEATS